MVTEGTDPQVAELRAELERLRTQLPAERPVRRGWWRPIVSGLLILALAVLLPLGIVARWAHDEIADTERYVDSVAELASDPDIQAAVTERITLEVTTRLRIQAVTQTAVDALSERGLGPLATTSLQALSTPLSNAVEGFIENQVRELVESDEFQQAWEEANRQAHTQLVAVLTGKDQGAVEVTGNTVSINLATLIESVKQRLVDRGFALAQRLPAVQAEFTIFQSDDLARAQNGFRLLSALNTALPIVALVLLVAAVAIGRDRRQTLITAMLAVAASMLLLGVTLNGFRIVYLDAVPTDQIPTDAAGAIYDTLVWFIRLNLRAILVLSLAVAFIAWVSGPGKAAVGLRRGTSTAIEYVRHGSERAGLDTGRLGVFLATYKVAIRGAVLGLALLVYVMADHPTGGFTLLLLVIAAVVLLLVELLARPPAASVADATPPSRSPDSS